MGTAEFWGVLLLGLAALGTLGALSSSIISAIERDGRETRDAISTLEDKVDALEIRLDELGRKTPEPAGDGRRLTTLGAKNDYGEVPRV